VVPAKSGDQLIRSIAPDGSVVLVQKSAKQLASAGRKVRRIGIPDAPFQGNFSVSSSIACGAGCGLCVVRQHLLKAVYFIPVCLF